MNRIDGNIFCSMVIHKDSAVQKRVGWKTCLQQYLAASKQTHQRLYFQRHPTIKCNRVHAIERATKIKVNSGKQATHILQTQKTGIGI